jgi:hypothetical protein
MTRPLIPTRGAYISIAILFHKDMPAPIQQTLIQLIALAWSENARMTAPLTYRALEGLTGKSVRTLYGHISVLQKKYAALRLQTAGHGLFVVELADWVFPPPNSGKKARKSLQLPVKEEEEDSMDESRMDSLLLLDSDQEEESEGKPRRAVKLGKDKTPQKPLRKLSPALREKLLAAGVFPYLLDEVVLSHYSEEELYALLAWSEHDHTVSTAGLFMNRLRKLLPVPEEYLQPPCRYCGLYGGKHTPDCRGVYISGKYADFIEH